MPPLAGIYDDRRYRHAAPGAPVRRRTTSSGGGGASSAAAAAPALAPLSAPPALAPLRAMANGRAAGARARQRRPRRKPRHLATDFADDGSDVDDMDAELAEAELREADEDEEEWQRRLKREQHDVDCVCGVSYDDGEGELRDSQALVVDVHWIRLGAAGPSRGMVVRVGGTGRGGAWGRDLYWT